MFEEIGILKLGEEELLSSDFQTCHRNLAVGDAEGQVFFVDINHQKWAKKHEGTTHFASSLCFSPSGQILAIGTTRSLRVVEAMSGAVLAEFQNFGNDVFGLSFSPEESLLAVACHDGTLRVITVKPKDIRKRMLLSGWKLLQKFCCGAWVQAVSFRNEEQLIWTVRDGTVRSVNPWNCRETLYFERPGYFPISICCSRHHILVGWQDGSVSLHDFQLNCEGLWALGDDWTKAICRLGSERYCAVFQDGWVVIFDLQGQVLQKSKLLDAPVYSASFEGESGILALCSGGGKLSLQKLASNS